ncbi:MAG TPA: pirin family protein [Xanthobacteraceae bacterium]|nr:pirin family protein [Xanthobacteraceae bacterium]
MEREIVRVHGVTKRGPSEQVNDKQIILQAGNYAQTTPFLMLSEDWFAAPRGFEAHPHRGMQTVTFVLEGALEHKDHTGGHGVLRAGDVQWMTAGRGVEHSEMPHGNEMAHTLQLWLNLPAKQKMTAARYVNQAAEDVPVRNEDGIEVRVYAGRSNGVEHPYGSDWPLTLLDIRMEPRKLLFQEIPAMYRGFVYVLQGRARIGAGGTPVAQGEVAWFDPSLGNGDDTLTIAADEQLRLLLFAAPPIQEPVAFGGPFVMNTAQEIQQAFADYRSGKFLEG